MVDLLWERTIMSICDEAACLTSKHTSFDNSFVSCKISLCSGFPSSELDS